MIMASGRLGRNILIENANRGKKKYIYIYRVMTLRPERGEEHWLNIHYETTVVIIN